jgi:hypothetical protein
MEGIFPRAIRWNGRRYEFNSIKHEYPRGRGGEEGVGWY